MSWRVVVVSKRSKLEYKMNYLVVRDNNVVRIHLSEIHTIMIESTAVSLTAMLMTKLQERKIKVIFCDNNRNPDSEVIPYYGCHNSTEKIKNQILWDKDYKDIVWAKIVEEKILNQAQLIEHINKDSHARLIDYSQNIEPGDKTNREAHAAKVYFNTLFGSQFSRRNDSTINASLNYGYTILLSAINREVVANGYITQIGIFHDNMFNQFNISSDLIEPLRPLVDKEVHSWGIIDELLPNNKMALVDLLNRKVEINHKSYFFLNALSEYCKSVFDAISAKNITLMRFIKL
ncbi:MAG: type II CRISPR-associated endonuclease Cas1 [Spirochaetia bacterium]|nr:type II CRISPR-associated endonuclease Cas1 [Spirochaetia bacterium]